MRTYLQAQALGLALGLAAWAMPVAAATPDYTSQEPYSAGVSGLTIDQLNASQILSGNSLTSTVMGSNIGNSLNSALTGAMKLQGLDTSDILNQIAQGVLQGVVNAGMQQLQGMMGNFGGLASNLNLTSTFGIQGSSLSGLSSLSSNGLSSVLGGIQGGSLNVSSLTGALVQAGISELMSSASSSGSSSSSGSTSSSSGSTSSSSLSVTSSSQTTNSADGTQTVTMTLSDGQKVTMTATPAQISNYTAGVNSYLNGCQLDATYLQDNGQYDSNYLQGYNQLCGSSS